MKITQSCLWDAISLILPKTGEARLAGVDFNLPYALNSAAIEVFTIINQTEFKLDYEKNCAAHHIREALIELRERGFMTFGTETKNSLRSLNSALNWFSSPT